MIAAGTPLTPTACGIQLPRGILRGVVMKVCIHKSWRVLGGLVLCGLVAATAGCNPRQTSMGDAQARQQALALLLPSKIRIEPFTRVTLDPRGSAPRDLHVYVRAEDQFGDPIKVAGSFNCELYTFKQASADPKGQRVELWRIDVLDKKDQRRYWDHTAQMYEFRLQIGQLFGEEGTAPLDQGQAVLLLTYNTPWGEHLEAEYILELRRQDLELADTSL